MHRYLALSWDPDSEQHTASIRRLLAQLSRKAPEMQPVFSAPGLEVYASLAPTRAFNAYTIGPDGGIVLGEIFQRRASMEGQLAPTLLSGPAAHDIRQTCGRSLVENFWGAYVAFVQDAASRRTFVVRAPAAELACYLVTREEITFIFSDVEDFLALESVALTINWQYVALAMMRPTLQSMATGLNEVQTLTGGECLELHRGRPGRRSLCWDLVRLAVQDPIEDLDTALRLVRQTVQACVAARASSHSHIFLRLSGGLDSSVVLACLAHAPSRPEVTCANYFDHSAGADERAYARMAVDSVAASSGVRFELVECERDPSRADVRQVLNTTRSPSPNICLTLLCERHTDLDLTGPRGATFFTGQAGDAIFYHSRGAATVADYVFRYGLRPGVARVAYESALRESTFWSTLSQGIRSGLFQGRRPYRTLFVRDGRLINPAILQSLKNDATACPLPPWYSDSLRQHARRLSHEKLSHIEGMCALSWNFSDPLVRAGSLQWAAPLASQPILELFARIPLYLLNPGGEDRGLARRAFAPDLSMQLLRRQTKSFLNGFYTSAVRQNMSFFREFLLDGLLVKQGLLDRTKLEQLLNRADSERAPGMAELVTGHFDVETWLRSWHPQNAVRSRYAA